jgi:hypothetical protein
LIFFDIFAKFTVLTSVSCQVVKLAKAENSKTVGRGRRGRRKRRRFVVSGKNHFPALNVNLTSPGFKPGKLKSLLAI